MDGQGAPSDISRKDKGLLPMKGQELCYQNYFRNQVFFHFFTGLIPILPTNAVRGDALFAVDLYIKQQNCRRRCLPASCLFMGRRVYWAGVIIVVMALRQNRPEGTGTSELMRMFGMSRKTLFRWISYFREAFPSSARWQRLRGRVHSSIRDSELPGELLRYFIRYADSTGDGLVGCLRFLATGLEGP